MNNEERAIEEREAFIQGLRQFADFLERTPAAPLPTRTMNAYVESKEALVAVAKSGSFEKAVLDYWFMLRKRFGPISYELNIEREKVCERRVVGTREEPAKTVEIVEWECAESLLE